MALIKRTSPCLCDSSHICLSALCRTSLVYLTHHGVVTLKLRQRSAVTGLTVSLMNGTEAYPGIGAYGWAKFVSSHCSFLAKCHIVTWRAVLFRSHFWSARIRLGRSFLSLDVLVVRSAQITKNEIKNIRVSHSSCVDPPVKLNSVTCPDKAWSVSTAIYWSRMEIAFWMQAPVYHSCLSSNGCVRIDCWWNTTHIHQWRVVSGALVIFVRTIEGLCAQITWLEFYCYGFLLFLSLVVVLGCKSCYGILFCGSFQLRLTDFSLAVDQNEPVTDPKCDEPQKTCLSSLGSSLTWWNQPIHRLSVWVRPAESASPQPYSFGWVGDLSLGAVWCAVSTKQTDSFPPHYPDHRSGVKHRHHQREEVQLARAAAGLISRDNKKSWVAASGQFTGAGLWIDGGVSELAGKWWFSATCRRELIALFCKKVSPFPASLCFLQLFACSCWGGWTFRGLITCVVMNAFICCLGFQSHLDAVVLKNLLAAVAKKDLECVLLFSCSKTKTRICVWSSCPGLCLGMCSMRKYLDAKTKLKKKNWSKFSTLTHMAHACVITHPQFWLSEIFRERMPVRREERDGRREKMFQED